MGFRMRLGGIGLGLAAVAALAAGCGSSSTPAAATPTGGNALSAYTTCLSKNGVTLPSASARAGRTGFPTARPSGGVRPSFSPGAGGGAGRGGFGGFGNQPPAGVSQETWDKAQQACASVRPSFGAGANGGGNNSAFVAYRNCLSEHGVTAAGPAQLNTADPKVVAAEAACAPLRPSGQPRPQTTPAAG